MTSPKRSPLSWEDAFRSLAVEAGCLAHDLFEAEWDARAGSASDQFSPSDRDAFFVERFLKSPRAAPARDYYELLHARDPGYQANNWLVEHLPTLLARGGAASVTEIGCGNGRFLRAVSPHVRSVTGVDFARSPLLVHLPENVTFIQGDVVTLELPRAELVCSADVLEHFEPRMLPGVVRKLHAAGETNYHVIACYDDRHSHATIASPAIWCALFRLIDPAYRISRVDCRRNDAARIVCAITNTQPVRRASKDGKPEAPASLRS